MNGLAFSLAKNTFLKHNSDSYYIVSEAPVKMLRVSKSFYYVLEQLLAGSDLSEIVQQHPEIKEGRLLCTLLSLTSKGYLRLDKLAEVTDYPLVSIIIPVRPPLKDLFECLNSLASLDYPAEKLEVLVVLDGPSEYAQIDAGSLNVRFIRLNKTQGPATARNIGAENASGNILAFLDADCIADKNWLKEIIPFFQIEGIGAVGGFVDSYYKKSYLDRYEEVSSSLNMGARVIFQNEPESTFYVPTCNFMVTRQAFLATGKFRDGWQVGEDVDFCWRMRDLGYFLLYIPAGKVAHKHRNQLFKMLHRRADYGTSEANLYHSHPNKKKKVLFPVCAGLSFLAVIAAVLLLYPYPVGLVLLFFAIDLCRRSAAPKRLQMSLNFKQTLLSTFRSHFSFYYLASFHLIRYYLILLLALGFLLHPVWLVGALALILTSLVDYSVKRPHLIYPVYLFFYILEQIAYQIGVFWGCFKYKYFGSYVLAFSRVR